MNWEKRTEVIGSAKLTDLIEAVLNIEVSESKKEVINHLIKTECLKYENVLTDIAEKMSYYQSDYADINQLMVKLNSVLFYSPKQKIE